MTRKKIFFLVASLQAGGSERVFWLLAQGFDKRKYEVFLIHLSAGLQAYPTDIEGVRVIGLHTFKVSRSFLALYRLFRSNRPYAVFSTGSHINLLVSIVSLLINIPFKIAREGNVFSEIAKSKGSAYRMWIPMINLFYRRFNVVVCQSREIREDFLSTFTLAAEKLIQIPNPVNIPALMPTRANSGSRKKILVVARLVPIKMHSRLLDALASLPEEYELTIAGEGDCRKAISAQILRLGLSHRTHMLGQVSDVSALYASHGLCVLSSSCEGFPNALLEAISHGTPVLSYRVGGVSELIIPGFNGFIAEKDDQQGYAGYIRRAFSQSWDTGQMRADLEKRFSLENIAARYQALIEPAFKD